MYVSSMRLPSLGAFWSTGVRCIAVQVTCLFFNGRNPWNNRDVDTTLRYPTSIKTKRVLDVGGALFASCRLTGRAMGIQYRRRRRGTSSERRHGTRVRRPTEARFDCQPTPNPKLGTTLLRPAYSPSPSVPHSDKG